MDWILHLPHCSATTQVLSRITAGLLHDGAGLLNALGMVQESSTAWCHPLTWHCTNVACQAKADRWEKATHHPSKRLNMPHQVRSKVVGTTNYKNRLFDWVVDVCWFCPFLTETMPLILPLICYPSLPELVVSEFSCWCYKCFQPSLSIKARVIAVCRRL